MGSLRKLQNRAFNDYGQAFDSHGKFDRTLAKDVIDQSMEIESTIKSTQLSIYEIKEILANSLSQSTTRSLHVVTRIKNPNLWHLIV